MVITAASGRHRTTRMLNDETFASLEEAKAKADQLAADWQPARAGQRVAFFVNGVDPATLKPYKREQSYYYLHRP